MKPKGYVIVFLLLIAVGLIFFSQIQNMYQDLRETQQSYFWVAIAYMAVLALGVSRSFILGAIIGVFSLFIGWHIFGAMMSDHRSLMLMTCGLVFVPLFLIFNGVQEGRIAGQQAHVADLTGRIGDAMGALSGSGK